MRTNCSGPLQAILQDMLRGKGVTDESWSALPGRVPRKNDPRLRDARFLPPTCPVGVLRHSIRSCKTFQRAEQAARLAGQRLLLAVAADRVESSVPPTARADSTIYTEALAVHTLNDTGNLQGIVFLYRGLEVCLKKRLSASLGIVRGCPVVVDDVILASAEPLLPCHQCVLTDAPAAS